MIKIVLIVTKNILIEDNKQSTSLFMTCTMLKAHTLGSITRRTPKMKNVIVELLNLYREETNKMHKNTI